MQITSCRAIVSNAKRFLSIYKSTVFYKWEGRFEEGILLTLNKVLNDLIVGSYKKGSVREGWKLMTNDVWNNEDENLRRAYRSNLRQLFYDLFMLLFV